MGVAERPWEKEGRAETCANSAGTCKRFVSRPCTRDQGLLDVTPAHCGSRPPTDAGGTEQTDPIDSAFCVAARWPVPSPGSTIDQWCERSPPGVDQSLCA